MADWDCWNLHPKCIGNFLIQLYGLQKGSVCSKFTCTELGVSTAILLTGPLLGKINIGGTIAPSVCWGVIRQNWSPSQSKQLLSIKRTKSTEMFSKVWWISEKCLNVLETTGVVRRNLAELYLLKAAFCRASYSWRLLCCNGDLQKTAPC